MIGAINSLVNKVVGTVTPYVTESRSVKTKTARSRKAKKAVKKKKCKGCRKCR